MLVDRVMGDAIHAIVRSHRVKMKLLTVMAARRRLDNLARLASNIDNVESTLFDPKRVAHMRNGELISLYNVLSSRELKTMEQMTQATDKVPTLTDEEVAGCLDDQTTGMPDVELPEAAMQRLAEGLSKLSNSIIQRETGLVLPPPVVQ